MYQEREDTERARDPHEHKHLRPETSADVQCVLGGDDVPEDHEHDCRDDRACRGEQRGDECPDCEGEG